MTAQSPAGTSPHGASSPSASVYVRERGEGGGEDYPSGTQTIVGFSASKQKTRGSVTSHTILLHLSLSLSLSHSTSCVAVYMVKMIKNNRCGVCTRHEVQSWTLGNLCHTNWLALL